MQCCETVKGERKMRNNEVKNKTNGNEENICRGVEKN